MTPPNLSVLEQSAKEIILAAICEDKSSDLTTQKIYDQIETMYALPMGFLLMPEYKRPLKAVIRNELCRVKNDSRKTDISSEDALATGEEDEKSSKFKKRKMYKSAEFIEDSSDLEELPEVKPKALSPQNEPSMKMVKSKETSIAHAPPSKRRKVMPSDNDSTTEIPRRSNSNKSKTKEEAVASDSDIASLFGQSPKPKQKPRVSVGKPSDKKSTNKGSKSGPSDKHEATIKKLKSFVNACGVRKPWAKIFRDLPKPTQQIAKLRELLAELGMTARLSMEQAKRIKAERELAKELADVQSFEHEMLNRAQSRTASTSRTRIKSGESEGRESEDDMRHRRRKVPASRNIDTLIPSDSEDD